MLPDFRVVTIAVISTFLFAASVGFYTSSRLAAERKPRPESLAAIEENPLNRIALNWPEPVQQTQNPLDLDFAVTAKVLRNPVRDVTDEPAPEPKVAAAPLSNPNVVVEQPAADLPRIEVPRIDASKIDAPKPEIARPEVAQIETPKVDTVTAPPAAPAPAPQAKPEDDIPTASIVERIVTPDPPSEEPKRAPEPVSEPPAAQVASRPDPESEEAKPNIEDAAGPAIKPTAAKPAAKKAARKKAKKAKARPRPRSVTTANTNSFFPFFGFQQ